MEWLTIVMNAVSAVVGQWLVANEEQRAAIEARALKAVSDMIADREAADKDHDELTKSTLAAIEAALAAKG